MRHWRDPLREAADAAGGCTRCKWEPRGKRRMHKRPGTSEIVACSVWLEAEVRHVQPRVVVALGATGSARPATG